MATKTVIEQRLRFKQSFYEKLQKAYIKLVEGGVKSYRVDDRELTRYDLDELSDLMKKTEQEIDELSAALEGKRPRKAFGIIPRDW